MALGVAVLAIWIWLLVARGGFWRMREEPVSRRPASATPVVAVIPARNEAAVVSAAVESLAKQDYAGEFHIVLVDDQSEDGTADRARAAAPAAILSVIAP